jgi:ClpP class serine protease
VRKLAPAVLERLGAAEAAQRIRALPPLSGSDTARATMPALERIARATSAPADPIRAASQCAGALLRIESPGGEEPGSVQLVAAVTRLANAAVRAGLPAVETVRGLAG